MKLAAETMGKMLESLVVCMYLPVECILKLRSGAGWSSQVARRAHNPKVGSSNLPPATS